MSSDQILLRSLLTETKDGEWGKELPFEDSLEMAVIRGTDFDTVKAGLLTGVPIRHIASKTATRKKLRPFDILIETAGGSKGKPTGKTTFLRPILFEKTNLPITCASFARFMRIDSRLAEPEFVYWYLQYLYYSGVIENHQVQHTGIARFQFTKFADTILINLPPLCVQKDIAAFLGTLDGRIALLRETNTTLEAIAQALFKSWFVDFDPVRAKQEGREPEGMDAETAALFPDSFEESELGLVPKGWRVDSIYKASQVIYGAPFASSKFNSEGIGKPLIRIRDLRNEAPGVFTPEIHPKGYLVKPGDIVVGMDGEFRAYLWGGEEAWLNQRVCVFVPTAGFPSTFVHRSIMPILAAVEASETATTVIHLGKNDIDRFRIVIPDEAVLRKFGEISESIYKKIVEQKQISRTLTTIRDTLLPRLISGQLRLPDAEAILEATNA